MPPRVLILHATGTNRDLEAAQAFELAGAAPEIVHLNQLRCGACRWEEYHILALPGGFSYADALGAGRLLALDLTAYFVEQVTAFVASGKPVIGICNGFQALVKAGILPGQVGAAQEPSAVKDAPASEKQPGDGLGGMQATLTFNASGHFECRWVTLLPRSLQCLWTRRLSQPIYCPVAHGEGRFLPGDLMNSDSGDRYMSIGGRALIEDDQIALVYALPDGAPAGGAYPYNPNGSYLDIAGICNPQGNVLGLMPHPEDHIFPYQHPRWTRGESGFSGLPLFKNGVDFAAQM